MEMKHQTKLARQISEKTRKRHLNKYRQEIRTRK